MQYIYYKIMFHNLWFCDWISTNEAFIYFFHVSKFPYLEQNFAQMNANCIRKWFFLFLRKKTCSKNPRPNKKLMLVNSVIIVMLKKAQSAKTIVF